MRIRLSRDPAVNLATLLGVGATIVLGLPTCFFEALALTQGVGVCAAIFATAGCASILTYAAVVRQA